MSLPKDPFMLLSFVNTKLRDEFESLDEFCKENGLSKREIEDVLKSIGYSYDKNTNSFK
ncbi:MAG: DUF4250 domain-containing protein [Clostridia bacterium]|nr:DUF4250 domain-containing protein [Clostridia bacterium]